MKREIRYHFYPGCCDVVLVRETEEHEEWRPMKIDRVARIGDPWQWRFATWSDKSSILTKEERKKIVTELESTLRSWLRWQANPNSEKGISETWINNFVESRMEMVDKPYSIH